MIRALTDIVLSLPVVGSSVQRHGNVHIAGGEQARLDAEGRVGVPHHALHLSVVEAALDQRVGPVAGARDVDQVAAQHVTLLRSEHQRQVRAV